MSTTMRYDCGHDIDFPSLAVPLRERDQRVCAFCRNPHDFMKHVEDVWCLMDPRSRPEDARRYIRIWDPAPAVHPELACMLENDSIGGC